MHFHCRNDSKVVSYLSCQSHANHQWLKMPLSIDTNHICLRKPSPPLFSNNSLTPNCLHRVRFEFLKLLKLNLMKYFWIRIATTLADSVLPLANHIMHQIPYLRKRWSTKKSKGEKAQTFSICWPNMHHSMCSLLLCKSNMDNVESELKACWNIDHLSVPCLLLIKACTHKNVIIKKSETAKLNPKTFMMIHTKINCSST